MWYIYYIAWFSVYRLYGFAIKNYSPKCRYIIIILHVWKLVKAACTNNRMMCSKRHKENYKYLYPNFVFIHNLCNACSVKTIDIDQLEKICENV